MNRLIVFLIFVGLIWVVSGCGRLTESFTLREEKSGHSLTALTSKLKKGSRNKIGPYYDKLKKKLNTFYEDWL